MPFKHDQTPWGNWLRGVKAATPSSTLITGQNIADDLRGIVQVGDVRSMAAPRGGITVTVLGVVAEFVLFELLAVRSAVIDTLIADSLAGTVTFYLEVHPPGTVPLTTQLPAEPQSSLDLRCTVGSGTTPGLVPHTPHVSWVTLDPLHKFERIEPMFIEEGGLFRMWRSASNTSVGEAGFLFRELPSQIG